MKKRTFLMAVITALFTACTSQVDVPEEGNSHLSGDRQEVKFTLSGFAGGEVPYTRATTPAYGDESKIDKLDIYVFGFVKATGDYIFEEVFSDVTLHGSGNDKTASIGILGKNDKRFYVIANGDFASLKTLVPGATTSDEFDALQTEELDLANGELLVCPLLMTGVSADIVINPYDGAPVQITLKRTVARFDIENDARQTNFYLKNVAITNTNEAAVILPNRNEVATNYAIPHPAGKIQYNLRNNANTGIVNSLFYLYPQTGKDIAAGGAYITVEGEIGEYPDNTKVTFDVPFISKATGNPINIAANTRYVIKINAATTSDIDATINTLEWNTATSVEEDMDAGKIQLTNDDGIPLTSAELLLDDGTPNERTKWLYVKATSEWEFAPDMPSWIKITDKKVNGKGVCTRFVVTAPRNQHAAPRNAVITLRSKLRPSITQSFVIRQAAGTPDVYPGTALNATEVAGIIWAPVNIGDTDNSKNGSLFQWGRGDAPLTYDAVNNKPEMVAGPLTPANASLPANLDKFIKLEQNTPNPNKIAIRNKFISICKPIYQNNNTAFDAYGLKTNPTNAEWNEWYDYLTPVQITEIVKNLFAVYEKAAYENLQLIVAPPYDWNATQDNNLWNPEPSLATGVNPCPDGWRLPTEEEINTLRNTSNTAYNKNTRTFADKITGETVSFDLPEDAIQISNKGKITPTSATAFIACYWTSSYSVSQMAVEYDAAGAVTRKMDVYKGQALQISHTKNAIVPKDRAEAHYIRCVLDN